MKVEEILELIPKEIPQDVKDRVDEYVFEHYIFIKNENGRHVGYCTHCGNTFEMDAAHNSHEECPVCYRKCLVKNTRYGRKYLINSRIVYMYQKPLKGEGIVVRGFLAERDYSGDYTRTETKYYEIADYSFRGEEAEMIRKDYWYNSCEKNFIKTKSIYNFDINGLARVEKYIDTESLEEAIKGTCYEYFTYFINKVKNNELGTQENYLKLLEAYGKYPILESLDKMGFTTIVELKVLNKSLERQVNFKKKDVFSVLGLNRAQVKEIQKSGVNVTPSFLKLYKENAKKKYKLTIEELKEIEGYEGIRLSRLNEIYKYANMKQVYRYIKKQQKNNICSFWELIMTWADYINDCIELKLDLTKDSVLFPKNVFELHIEYQKRIKYVKNKKYDELIRKKIDERNKFKFEYEELLIRPAISSQELIDEGAEQNHCVASYTERYAKGETNILFIRKKEDENKSYYTVEIANDFSIVQVRGKRNEDANEEVRRFMDVYKIVVLNVLRHKKKIA